MTRAARDALEREVARSADPEGAPPRLARWIEAAGRDAGRLLRPAGAARALTALLATGDWAGRALVRDPGALAFALAGGVRPPAGEVERRIRAALSAPGPAAAAAAVRLARRREVLRILLADVLGGAPLEEVAGALSDLADATLRAVVDRELATAASRDGPPLHADGSPASFSCLALGKLGGRELNYSSDVDLVFLRSDDGATRPARGLPPRSLHEHTSAVAGAVVRALSTTTSEGHLFRVDLRLRPQGGAGAVVPRLVAAVHHYRNFGRAWERQALLKARPVAGDLALGERFLRELEPWVLGRPFLSAEIAEVRRLKREIERSAEGREGDLKVGRGGIRDVEFVVQFLVLLLGAAIPEVRSGSTLEALRRLEAARALSAGEARALAEAYVFLRTAEHRLQAADDLRTHTLPADDAGLALLARRMGLGAGGGDPAGEFRRLHAVHAAAARGALDRLFHNAFAAEEEKARRIVDLLLLPGDPATAALEEALGGLGFHDPAAAFRDLRTMASAGSPWLPRQRTYFASAAPALLARASETPEPDRALVLVRMLSERAAGSGLFYTLLTENPDVLGVFCDLGGGGPYLAGLLAARPHVMDAFLDALVVAPRDGLPPFEDLPLRRIGEAGDPYAALLDLRDLELLRIGVRDLQGKANARQTARELSAAAASVVRLAAEAVGTRLRARYGAPPGRFAVLGLGRLGAGEMAYGSDLDLLFLHDGEGACPDGTEASGFFTRRARDLVALLGGTGDRGPVYRVDLRLRPDGRKGSLVASLAGFERYQRTRAGTWERQALVRCRPVAGDPGLGREAAALVEDILWGAPPPPGVAAEVRAMRARVEEHGTPGSLKTGRGGIQDAEFLAQALLLRHGHAHPAVREANTVSALGALRAEGLLSPEEQEGLVTACLFLRTVEMRLRLAGNASGSVLPGDPAALDDLARRLGYVATAYASPGRHLREEVDYYRGRMRGWFDAVMDRETAG